MTRVLFVCLGNICRSPTADGVFRKLIADSDLASRVEVDSAGTAAWHIGSVPDKRSTAAAQRRGYDLTQLRARQVTEQDFVDFDYILAMDLANLEELRHMSPPDHLHKVRLLLEFAPGFSEQEVPDPYYGGSDGFDHVLDLVEAASAGLLEHLRARG